MLRAIPFFLILAAPLAARNLSILIVDGMNNHDWQAATRETKAILLSSGRFTVDVSTAPLEAWNSWHPEFSKYDAVLVNFNGGEKPAGVRWPSAVEKALEEYVRKGGGLIVLHAANNAFLLWPEWNEMIGLGWRNKDFGPGLYVAADGSVETVPQGSGLNPGHPPRMDFTVRVVAPDHPITRGMPKTWVQPSEQLTHGQHGPAHGLTILTCADSPVSQHCEPMDWVRAYGEGRIYTTMLGHTWKNEPNPNYECASFRALLARGVEWAASGVVTMTASRR